MLSKNISRNVFKINLKLKFFTLALYIFFLKNTLTKLYNKASI